MQTQKKRTTKDGREGMIDETEKLCTQWSSTRNEMKNTAWWIDANKSCFCLHRFIRTKQNNNRISLSADKTRGIRNRCVCLINDKRMQYTHTQYV